MACLDDDGLVEIEKLMDYYLENAKILKEVWSATPRCPPKPDAGNQWRFSFTLLDPTRAAEEVYIVRDI